MKRVITKLKINELSAVDKPAQEGAKKVIMKHSKGVESLLNGFSFMSVPDDTGHSHSFEVNTYSEQSTSNSSALHADHRHPYEINEKGLVVGESMGHTHEIDGNELLGVRNKLINILATMEKKVMSTTKTESTDAEIELQKKIDDLTDQLKVSKAFSELNDVEKNHAISLDKKQETAFIAKSNKERAEIIKNLLDKDSVIYKSLSGEEFRKSDDSRLVTMAKRADENETELKKQVEQNANAVLEKRAETELEFMPGTLETRTAIVKALDAITDVEVRKAAIDSMKAKNASMSKAFKTVGDSGESSSSNNSLDELAKKYAIDKSVSYYDAYDAVSKANPEILKNAVQGK